MAVVKKPNNENKQQKNVTRRDYIKTVSVGALMTSLGVYLGVRLGWLFSSKNNKQQGIHLGTLSNILTKDGEWLKIKGKPAQIQIRDNKVRVMSLVCTHLGCIVLDKTNDAEYKDNPTQYFCPCHGGHYTVNGEKIRGPQPTSLPFYEVYLDGDDVYAEFYASISNHSRSWLEILD
ncbi:ubiquinol-cytochrome c reductase iron-sulfur subunit [Chlamydiia bacterium]|nr:ubiquinol-cytochrome c reductase iron-sulfur subunit [Chlamydiia bacterium]